MKRTLIAAALTLAASPTLAGTPASRVGVIVAASVFASKCPYMDVDGTVGSTAVVANGYKISELERIPEVDRTTKKWLRDLDANREAGCLAIWNMFGPKGTHLPGLLIPSRNARGAQ